MKIPITLGLLLPVLILTYIFISGDLATVLVFTAITGLLFLIEIWFKYRSLSWKNIVNFFSTPIIRTDMYGEEISDRSPKFSMLSGVAIILGGAILVIAIIIFVFAFLIV
jgi:hypothetical protein